MRMKYWPPRMPHGPQRRAPLGAACARSWPTGLGSSTSHPAEALRVSATQRLFGSVLQSEWTRRVNGEHILTPREAYAGGLLIARRGTLCFAVSRRSGKQSVHAVKGKSMKLLCEKHVPRVRKSGQKRKDDNRKLRLYSEN